MLVDNDNGRLDFGSKKVDRKIVVGSEVVAATCSGAPHLAGSATKKEMTFLSKRVVTPRALNIE